MSVNNLPKDKKKTVKRRLFEDDAWNVCDAAKPNSSRRRPVFSNVKKSYGHCPVDFESKYADRFSTFDVDDDFSDVERLSQSPEISLSTPTVPNNVKRPRMHREIGQATETHHRRKPRNVTRNVRRTAQRSEQFLSTDACNELTLNADNLDWLLNFRIQEVVRRLDFEGSPNQRPIDESPVGHDHNYEPIEDSEKKKSRTTSKRTGATQKDGRNLLPMFGSPYGASKPPYTFTEMIELALQHCRQLTVSGIYKWIATVFPFFEEWDSRWKNSIRHNLSINPQFKKGAKAEGGGHQWTLVQDLRAGRSPISRENFLRCHWKKRKLDELGKMFKKRSLVNEQFDAVQQNLLRNSMHGRHNWWTPNLYSRHDDSLEESANRILQGNVPPDRRVDVEYLPPHPERCSDLYYVNNNRRNFEPHFIPSFHPVATCRNPVSSFDGLMADSTFSQNAFPVPRMRCELDANGDFFDYDILRALTSSPL